MDTAKLHSIQNGYVRGTESMKRILFLDPKEIDGMDNVRLTVNPPQDQRIILSADRPWEDMFVAFNLTVIEEHGKLRMWYTCRDAEWYGGLAYAESADGIHWEKLDLGIVEYKGSKHNNLVGIPSLAGTVFVDPNASQEAKYKYMASVYRKGIFFYTSPDGFHWKRDEEPFLPFVADSQNVVFWDPNLSEYVFYLRGWPKDKKGERKRTVVRMSTADITSPSPIRSVGDAGYFSADGVLPHITTEMPTVLACDEYDPDVCDVYTNAALPYPVDERYYLAFPAFYFHFPNPPVGKFGNDGRLDVHFMGSMDGINWNRYNRSPYLRLGLDGTATSNMLFIGHGMLHRGDQLWQYATGYRTTHGDIPGRKKNPDGVILHLVQRVDGFVSADTNCRGGTLTTGPVSCTGDRLVLNLDAGALGDARVEILDAEGNPAPGFSAKECDPVRTNSVSAQVSWKETADIGSLRGRTIKLRFITHSCKLYSALFAEAD